LIAEVVSYCCFSLESPFPSSNTKVFCAVCFRFFGRAAAAFRASCLTNRLPKYLRLFSPPSFRIFCMYLSVSRTCTLLARMKAVVWPRVTVLEGRLISRFDIFQFPFRFNPGTNRGNVEMGLIDLAYLVTLNQRVQGSSPCAPTTFHHKIQRATANLARLLCL